MLAQNKTSALVDPISEIQQKSRPAAGNTNHEAGRAIYNFYCYFCHGYSGNAQTLAATYLNPKPRNFTATVPDTLSREKMIDAVTNGRSGTAMKSFNHALTEEDIEAVVSVLRSDFLTQGPAVGKFEEAVAEYCGARYAVAVNSATSALHLACIAAGLGPGDTLWTSP